MGSIYITNYILLNIVYINTLYIVRYVMPLKRLLQHIYYNIVKTNPTSWSYYTK